MKPFLQLMVVSLIASFTLIVTSFFMLARPVASQTQQPTSLSLNNNLLLSSQTIITFTPVATAYLPIVLRNPASSGTPPANTPTPTLTATPTSTPTATSVPSGAKIEIIKIEYDPLVGTDIEGEYVDLKNLGQSAADLTDWTLRDVADTVFTFPAFTLNSQATVRVWVKSGANTATDLYWNRGSAVWNNNGDTATLRDNAGSEVDNCTYPDGGTGSFDCN